MIQCTLRITKTAEQINCPDHGDGVAVRFEDEHNFGHPFKICYRCLDEAIEQYQEPHICKDCGDPINKGDGLEKDGVLIKLCTGCTVKRTLRRQERT